MNPSDLPLDQLRLALAPRVAAAAIFDGWTDAALASAAVELGVPGATARIAFPDGAMDMIDACAATEMSLARPRAVNYHSEGTQAATRLVERQGCVLRETGVDRSC